MEVETEDMPCNRSLARVFLSRFAKSSPLALRSSGFDGINKKITKKKELCRSRARQTGSKSCVHVYNLRFSEEGWQSSSSGGDIDIALGVLAQSGRLYCHVFADVLVCWSLVAIQCFNIKRLILLGVIR